MAVVDSRIVYQVSGFTALARRGDCDYLLKAKVAQAAGATGLVVVNDSEGAILFKLPYFVYVFLLP